LIKSGWKKPRRIFVDSMSDLFHPGVPFEFIRRVFGVMSEAPQHAYLVLTKRPQRMQEYVRWAADHGVSVAAPSSVWLGVSVEDQKTTDDRVQILLDTPAAHRFVSVEPLLGPVDLCAIPLPDGDQLGIGLYSYRASAGLDWVIVGGESGPGARRCDRGWIRSIVQQCGSAETPVFVKQLGEFQLTSDPDSRIDVMNQHSDRAGRDPSEWPPDLRVQQFPEGLCPAK